jgi:peptidoglycan hydrolase-like protein with peptidoglycan-binding domain
VIVVGSLIVVAVGATAVLVINDRGGEPSRSASAVPTSTAPITRGDVVDTESVDGKLTYSDSRSITAGGAGVVTKAPAAGATITRGSALYKAGNKPVVLMYGALPLYRTLSQGVDDGPDVRQLERNLKTLGYGDGMTVDKDFTAATAAAVEDWQDDMGLPETGRVDASQVVFQPGAVRISDVKAPIGQQVGPGRPVLTVSDTRSIVHVDLDAAKQSLAHKGASVKVELPNGRRVTGRITSVGTAAKTSGSQDQQTTTIDVDITLNTKKTGNLDQAPVTVDMESEHAKDVLSVPIEALLGLREGGFGVEVVEGTTSRIVPVRTGTFGSGRVEVTGAGVREGMRVGVAAS